MKLMMVLIFMMMIAGDASCGEPKKVQYTGNPNVDFFGVKNISGEYTAASLSSRPAFQFMSSSEEKSPWIAGALSLAVPGAGEVYAESYLKGAIFFAAEVATWIVAYTYDKKGDRQTDLFQDYANQHWSAVRYASWLRAHLTDLNSSLNPDSFHIYYNPQDMVCGPPFPCLNWNELNRMEGDIGDGFTHRLPAYNEQQYYELIGKYHQFSRGWDDSPQDPAHVSPPILSTSQRFYEYADMRAKANSYYDVANTAVAIIVINHIVSAIDAAWTASRHNSAFRASLKMHLQPTPMGVLPVTEASVQYTF